MLTSKYTGKQNMPARMLHSVGSIHCDTLAMPRQARAAYLPGYFTGRVSFDGAFEQLSRQLCGAMAGFQNSPGLKHLGHIPVGRVSPNTLQADQ